MDFREISIQLEQSAGLRLLKSDYSSILINFFYKTFFHLPQKILPYSSLIKQLGDYIEAHETGLKNKPAFYVDTWADDKHRYIRKYYIHGQNEPVTELNHDVEHVIDWVMSLKKNEFVGGGSRLSSLFSSIEQFGQGLITDPKWP